MEELGLIERIWDTRDLVIQIIGMIVVAASMLIAGTKTPDPNSMLGRIYKVVEWAALNFGKAKEQGDADDKPK